jgi:pimeloyl-ACP methyl ester carboxylesterase
MKLIEEKELGYYPIFKFERMLNLLKLRFDKPRWDEMEQIKCPTLIIKGSDNGFQREYGEKMSKLIKNCQLIEIPNAGHVVHDDQPKLFRTAVENFLSEL